MSVSVSVVILMQCHTGVVSCNVKNISTVYKNISTFALERSAKIG